MDSPALIPAWPCPALFLVVLKLLQACLSSLRGSGVCVGGRFWHKHVGSIMIRDEGKVRRWGQVLPRAGEVVSEETSAHCVPLPQLHSGPSLLPLTWTPITKLGSLLPFPPVQPVHFPYSSQSDHIKVYIRLSHLSP